jgi:parallel beta helix pectate lyase-like protein
MNSTKHLMMIALAVCISGTAALAERSFYVSPNGSDSNRGTEADPFLSIERARDAIRALPEAERRQDIRVMLRGGTHVISSTIVLGLQDGAPDGYTVSYEAYPGEEPVLSSGIPIRGWQKLTKYPEALPDQARGKVWVARMPEGANSFVTLFEGDRRLRRARSATFMGRPPEVELADSRNVLHNRDRIYLRRMHYPRAMIRDWPNLPDIEVLFDPVPWCLNIIPLESVDEEAGVAMLAYEANSPPFTGTKVGAWVENAIDFLDEPGNWAVNTQEREIYYWPKSGRPSDKIVAPRLQEFIRVEGRIRYDLAADVPVRNIVFKGLTFKHGERSRWFKNRKGWGIQHDWDTFDYGNAMLRFRGAENCVVDECRFTASGGSGMRLDLHCQRNTVRNSMFDRLGHMGILLAGYGPGTKDVNKGNRIHNNIIHHVGEVIWHGHGIFLWQSGENEITHNWIHDVPRKAIGVAGPRCQILMKPDVDFDEASKTIRWHEIEENIIQEGDIQERYLPFLHARNNLIANNKVTHALMRLNDGGSINVSGAGAGNVIRHNFVYDVASTAFRTDDWQRYTITENNIVYRCRSAFIHKDFNHIRNNIVVDTGEGIRFRLFPKQQFKPGSDVQRNIIHFTDSRYRLIFSRQKVNGKLVHHQVNVDYNVYSSPDAQGMLESNREHGIDLHSVVADPLFMDPANGDFRLRPNSPAFEVGFEPFDVNLTSFGITDDYPERLRLLDPPVDEFDVRSAILGKISGNRH